MTGDVHVAEDLAQEAVARAWQHRSELRDPARATAWLYRIALNLVRQRARRRRWRWLGWDHPDAARLSSPALEPPDRLRAALRSLDPDDRSILLLVGYHGWTPGEVADAMAISRDAVYKRWQRACARFRAAWEAQDA